MAQSSGSRAEPAGHARMVLQGGGDAEQSADADQLFVSMLDKARPVLYVPVAMHEGIYSYASCRTWFEGCFGRYGITDVVMWTDEALAGRTLRDLESFGGIYVGGGNTYKLLDIMRRSGFLSRLRGAIENGTPYFGGSAGAILAGRDISTAFDDESTMGCLDLSALGVVGDYLIGCHLQPDKEILFKRLAGQHDLAILAITEDAAVVVEQGRLAVLGRSDCAVKLITAGGTTTYSQGATIAR